MIPTLMEFKSSPDMIRFIRERFNHEWSEVLEPGYRHEFTFMTEAEMDDEKETNWQQEIFMAYSEMFPSNIRDQMQETYKISSTSKNQTWTIPKRRI